MAEIEAFDPDAFAAFKRQADPAPEIEAFDPQGFEAFKAQAAGTGRQGGAMNAAARGFVEGIPIAGPYALAGIDRADAALRSYQNGTGYDDEVARAGAYGANLRTQHPYATTAGEVAGGIAGTAPLIAAAPAAFGAGAAALPARMAASLFSGGALGAADSAVRSGGDLIEARNGAIAGGVGGVLAPATGATVGAGARKFYDLLAPYMAPASGFGRAATGILAEDAAASGGVGAVRNRLAELGPDAMLLDASHSFQGQAAGLAMHPETRQTINDPIAARAAGMTDRLSTDINGALGPAVSPQAATDTFAAARRIPNDAIGDAVRSAGPIDTTDVLTNLADRLRTAEGPQRTALMQARGMLMTEHPQTGAMIPQMNAQNLQNAKTALSGMMEHGAEGLGVPRGSVAQRDGALGATVADLNGALRAQIPGYGAANDVSAALARRMEAVETGSQLLRSGEAATPPEDLARRLAGMSEGERDALAIGTRGAIDRAVGTRRNDLTAMQGVLQGEGGWNAQNLAQVHGQGSVDRIVGAVNREAAFDQANRKIVEGSQTAQRLASAARVAPRVASSGSADVLPGIAAMVGGADAGTAALAAKLGLGGLKLAASTAQRNADLARNRELASAVTMRPGAMMDTFLAAIGARDAMRQRALMAGEAARLGTQAGVVSQSDRLRGYVPSSLPALPALGR